MTGRERKPLHPVGAVGLILLVAGLLGWLWTGEWKWVVTGAGLLFATAAVGAAIDNYHGRKQ